MSFPFRPSLSDRFKGKSGDEIFEEMRQSLDENRKKFFESKPEWGSSTAGSAFRRGFQPRFDDSDKEGGLRSGKSRLDDCLDDIVQRHPEVADQLKDWRTSSKPSRYPEEPPENPLNNTNISSPRKTNLRNTVPDMQAAQEEDRGQRSQSAPPQDSHKHVSKVEIPSVDKANEEKVRVIPIKVCDEPSDSMNHIEPDHNFTSQQAPPPQQQQQQGPLVRHIPIFVEGRDTPIIPKEAHEPQQQFRQQTQPPSWQARSPNVPKHSQPQRPPRQPSPRPPEQPSAPTPSPKQSNLKKGHSVKISTDEVDNAGRATPPPQKQVKQETPLEKVAAVQKEVDELKAKVEKFSGSSRSDKEYIYLDEMLTRNLLKLDNIETEGKEDVRAARRNVIKDIQKYISLLESKCPISNEKVAKMDVDDSNTGATEPMDQENIVEQNPPTNSVPDDSQEAMSVDDSTSKS